MTQSRPDPDERRPGSPLAEHLGFEMVDTNDEHTLMRLAIEPHHLNPMGMVHGGTILSLADNAATACANRAHAAIEDDGRFMAGIDLHAVLLGNQRGGTIEADARTVRAGRRVVVVRTRVTGDDGRLIAEVTTTHIPT